MINQLIREGIVTTVYPERCSCRVTFTDRDNLVSAELPILQAAGARNRYYSLVDVGDSVVCLMMPNARDGTGYVLGSRYDERNEPPTTNGDESMIRFDDGTAISYNRGNHTLTIDCVGTVRIKGKRIELN